MYLLPIEIPAPPFVIVRGGWGHRYHAGLGEGSRSLQYSESVRPKRILLLRLKGSDERPPVFLERELLQV